MSKYTLLPCFTCSHWDLVSCFISLVRFPLGYFPEFKLPPFVVFPLFFDVLPHPNEGHLCLSNDLHPPCIFQFCLLNCCISKCRSNCHSLNFDLLDVWFLDSRRLVDYWFCLLIWNWLQVADLLSLKSAFILTLSITKSMIKVFCHFKAC